MKRLLVGVLFALLGFVPYASAAQLDAAIIYDDFVIEPSFEFLRIVYIEYPDGGEIADLLQDKRDEISFVVDSDGVQMDDLLADLNENLGTAPSNAVITDVKMIYHAILQANANSAVIEYKLQLLPTITNHATVNDSGKSMVDANWRGISLDGPIVVQNEYGLFDVNNPRSAFDVMIPNVSEKFKDVSILEMPLARADNILSLPLYKWHSLFDNTAIIPGAVEYKYVGKNVITHYSMGECKIELGFCDDREWIENIDLDKKYAIRIVESSDDATIAIEGYVDTTVIDGIEVFQVDLHSPVTQKPDTDEFPTTVMYGMAAIAAIGGVAMFVISDRKIKRNKDGDSQTGIDPSQLISYETSSSAGGYKTNRGESYLISDEESRAPL